MLGKLIGLPYGSYARFILLFLQSEAVKTRSRTIELGRSMRVWLGTMGLSIGGMTYKMVNEQARRISLCNLTFYADRGHQELIRRGGFVDGAITVHDVLEEQPGLWKTQGSERGVLQSAARPPSADQRGRVKGDRAALDGHRHLYLACVPAARARQGGGDRLAGSYSQFGAGYGRLRDFRAQFLEALQLAVAAYPDARVVLGDRGVILRPSRPAIAKV